ATAGSRTASQRSRYEPLPRCSSGVRAGHTRRMFSAETARTVRRRGSVGTARLRDPPESSTVHSPSANSTLAIALACLLATGCHAPPRRASVLLFTGRGTSSGDVAAVEQVLRDAHLSYATASSRQLGALNPSQLRVYRLLIVPGGNFEQMGNSL